MLRVAVVGLLCGLLNSSPSAIVSCGSMTGRWFAGGPARAVEGLLARATSTACGEARAKEEAQNEYDDDDGQQDPSAPVIPGTITAVIAAAPGVVTVGGHFAEH